MSPTAPPPLLEEVLVPPAAVAWRLVSAGLGYPDAVWRARFDGYLERARRAGSVPPAGLARLEKSSAKIGLEGLAAQHYRLFGSAGACPLELALHSTRDASAQARKLADFSGFYRAFGVEPEGRADSLPTVLEFLAYLEIKRVHAEKKGWTARGDIARDASFRLRCEAVLKPVGLFARRLSAAGAPDFYLQLAALCRTLVGGAR